MNFVCVCPNCSKTIEKEFIYCPWCGERNALAETNDEAIFDKVFEELEKKQASDISKRINSMKKKLSELEGDLERLENLF